MPRSFSAVVLLIICAFLSGALSAQFRNVYIHSLSDDHTAMEKSILGAHYIQVSTTQGTTKDIHLMKLDASGNVVLDKLFFSPTSDEVALDICRGNGHSYVICGYETVGALDLGFVLRVDTNFNFINKVNIQVQTSDRHTPALNIINSAFYETPSGSPNPYFPPDPSGGYLVTGFEAVGYAPTDPKSGYALKLTDGLAFQWVAKYDSPVTLGAPDWDMCSHGTYMWAGAKGYFIGGSGTSPTGEQVALASEMNLAGTALWTKRYTDSTTPGSSTVAVDAAFDDAPLELYQLTNHSSSQGGGFITFEQGTGVIDPFLCSRFLANSPNYYVYEFGATCASSILIISGYGHNQTAGSTSGLFPFSFRYDKGINPLPFPSPPAVDPSFSKYAYPVQSPGYSPSTTIFDKYTTGTHSRIYHPKMFAQLGVNEVTLAAFEDVGTDQENHIVHPYFSGADSCSYIDPGFARAPMPLTEWPAGQQPGTYVITPGTYASSPQTPIVQQCQNCTVDLTYTTTIGPNCTWTLTANNPGFCPLFTITDIANTVVFTGPGPTVNVTFPLSGTYTICYADCGVGTNGVVCREELCTTLQVNCPPPCPVDADFAFTVNGCCVNFNDLTPEGNPNGCERWVFGNVATVNAGDVTSFCFPGPGTYTVCHVDCCMGSDGTMTYHQVCKQVTVNCSPPCCLPTGINVTVNNCCVTVTANLPTNCLNPPKMVWSFGDGNLSFSQNATHCYKGSGFYTVCLTAYCTKTQKVKFCKTVKVLCAVPPPPPNGGSGTAKFSFSTSGTSIALTPAPAPPGLAINARTWSFGDGQSSTVAAPSHYYPLSGTYDIVHTVEGTDLLSGAPFIEADTVPVTLVLAPACGCLPPPVGGYSATSLTCGPDDPVLLRLIDQASESDIVHQWMVAACGTSGCPTTEFVPVPGAVGQHVWVDNPATTAYYRCRSTSPLGFVHWSEEVEVTQGEFILQLSGPLGPVCPAASVPLVATGAAEYAWSNGETSESIVARPPVTTTYSVDGTNTAGCMAGAEVTVVVEAAGCAADVQVRVLLEGPLNSATALMNDALRAAGLVPLAEPYTALGYTWPAGSSGSSTTAPVLVVTGPDAVVDWVLVELRDPAQPDVVLATRSALLQRDGDVVDADGTSALRFTVGEGGYQVAVLHRNHLAVMAAAPSTLGSVPAALDLASPAVATFGTNARKAVGGPPALMVLWAGDVTFNGEVKYTGSGNDRDPLLVGVGGTTPNNVAGPVYDRRDVNLDGSIKYTGTTNDRDPILVNVGGTTPNNVRLQQVP